METTRKITQDQLFLMLDEIDAEYETNGHSDRYYDLRDEMLTTCDENPLLTRTARDAGYPV